jgi:hypothetical protein
MKFFARLLLVAGLTLPVSAMAQSVGTVTLPSGPGVMSSALLAAAINQALTGKLDAGAAAIAAALGYTPASTVSPAFTGTPTAPTAAPGTSTTQLATTAFVQNSSAAVTSVAGLTGAITTGQLAGATQGTTATTLAAGNDSRINGACQKSGCTYTGLVTAPSLTMTGAFTPSTTAGIVGTKIGDSPAAGSVGEIIQASLGLTAMTSGTQQNLVGITLTPGDWIIYGAGQLACTGTGITEGYLNVTGGNQSLIYLAAASADLSYWAAPTYPLFENVTSNTTVYVVAYAACSGGGAAAANYSAIEAERIR